MSFRIGDNEHIHAPADLSGDEVELLFGSVWRGPKGEKGDKGDAGNQGPTGPQGVQGEIGPTGPKGLQGTKGDQGPQGERGYKGDTGACGPQGEKGEKGDRGDKGESGDPGERGLPGLTGPKGVKGEKGDNTATFIDIDATNDDHELLKGQVRKAEQALRATAETLIVVRDGGIDYTSIVATTDKGILQIIACAIDEPGSKIRAIQIDATYTQCAILTVTVVRREQSMSGLLYVPIGDIAPDTDLTILHERFQPVVDRAVSSTAFPVIGLTDNAHIYGFCRWEPTAARAVNQRLIISFCGWIDQVDGIAYIRLSLACSVIDGSITAVEILSGPQTESLSDCLSCKADLDEQLRFVRKEQIDPMWKAIVGAQVSSNNQMVDIPMPVDLQFDGSRTYELIFQPNSLAGDLGIKYPVFSDGAITLADHHVHHPTEGVLINQLSVANCGSVSFDFSPYYVMITIKKREADYEVTYYANGGMIGTGIYAEYTPTKIQLGGGNTFHVFRITDVCLREENYLTRWNEGRPSLEVMSCTGLRSSIKGEFVPDSLVDGKWFNTTSPYILPLNPQTTITFHEAAFQGRTPLNCRGACVDGGVLASVDPVLIAPLRCVRMSVELSVTTLGTTANTVLFSTVARRSSVPIEDDNEEIGYLIGISENGYWRVSHTVGSGSSFELTEVEKPSPNSSYHLVLCRNANIIQLYINGTMVWEQANWKNDEVKIGYVFLGAPGMNGIARWSGCRFHSVRLFNETLTGDEVALLWNNGLPLLEQIKATYTLFDTEKCVGEFVSPFFTTDVMYEPSYITEWRNTIQPGRNLYGPGIRVSTDLPTFRPEQSSGNGYTLPLATTETLGGIKVGNNLSMREDGTLDAEAGGGGVLVLPYVAPERDADGNITNSAAIIAAWGGILAQYLANPDSYSLYMLVDCGDGTIMRLPCTVASMGAGEGMVAYALFASLLLGMPGDRGMIDQATAFCFASVACSPEHELQQILEYSISVLTPANTYKTVLLPNVMAATTDQAKVDLLNSIMADLYEARRTGKIILQVQIYDYICPATYYFNGPSVVISASHITPESGGAMLRYFAVNATIIDGGQGATPPVIGSVNSWAYASKQL